MRKNTWLVYSSGRSQRDSRRDLTTSGKTIVQGKIRERGERRDGRKLKTWERDVERLRSVEIIERYKRRDKSKHKTWKET